MAVSYERMISWHHHQAGRQPDRPRSDSWDPEGIV